MNLSELQEKIGKCEGLLVVKFSADWCAPCKALEKTFHEISGNFKLVEADCGDDSDPDIATHFNIRNLPTVIFFKDGLEVHKFTGTKQKAQLQELIDQYL